jgi:multidrug efflux pump subunit AcrA (membrane-fusion protein)
MTVMVMPSRIIAIACRIPNLPHDTEKPTLTLSQRARGSIQQFPDSIIADSIPDHIGKAPFRRTISHDCIYSTIMNTSIKKSQSPQKPRWYFWAILLPLFVALAVGVFYFPQIRQFAKAKFGTSKPAHSAKDGHDHAHEATDEHDEEDADHDHEKESAKTRGAGDADHDEDEHDAPHESKTANHKHEEAAAVKLSLAAQANVGLRLEPLELKPFERTMKVPAMIVERPGRSSIHVAAPLTGVVTRVWPLQGETVTPGQPLFDLRLTHEEVVEAQAEFLKISEELDVVQREIDRLEKIASEGVVSGKTLLERKYEQQKLMATQRSQRQRLLLHGLSKEQVDGILATHALLNTLTVYVPQPSADKTSEKNAEQVLQVQEVKVENGQHVKAGDPLCVLADHTELYLQGKAFEQDAASLNNAADNGWTLSAVVDAGGKEPQTVTDLRLLYVANKIEPDSRAFLFYVQLPNRLVRNRETDGHRFSAWQFKPGQRVEILVPIERWTDRIVLPVNAVVQDGPESYVFEENDGHFDRRSVHVEYRDEYSAVIANDGALTPGKSVVAAGAYQLHLAMKNKSGGAPDPHAGHNH